MANDEVAIDDARLVDEKSVDLQFCDSTVTASGPAGFDFILSIMEKSMRIRSITVFTGRSVETLPDDLLRAGALASEAKAALIAVGYEVQTVRVALPPADMWLPPFPMSSLPEVAQRLEKSMLSAGMDYLSLGTLPVDALPFLPALIARTQSVFASFSIASEREIFMGTLARVSRAILEVAAVVPDGFGNLRFCAVAGGRSGTPFFPAACARHAGDFSFALALECADLAATACQSASSTTAAMETLTREIERHSHLMHKPLAPLSDTRGAEFLGFDWSLAPHPDKERSIGAALEALSGTAVGGWGTLTAVAALTRAIRNAAVRHVGFSGVFLPVLEDAVLAARAVEGTFDLPRLLLYSAVCGSGLDTIPLPGDVRPEAISALLADVATLAVVLQKPLTVRLMPVPGLTSGRPTAFHFPFLVNTHALSLPGSAAKLLRDERLVF